MRVVFSLLTVGIVFVGSFGCQSSEDASTSQAVPVAAPTETQTVEAGCASCIFNMDGIEDCQLAVKIDDKPYLVNGSDVDAHESGLCNSVNKAVLAGEIEGDKFVATKFELQ